MGTRALVAVWLVLAASLAGCTASRSNTDSSSDFTGASALVASTIEDLESAASKGDEGEICGQLLAARLADRLSARGKDCGTVVQDALDDTDTSNLTVESVRITGDRAVARVKAETGDHDRIETVGLVRERNRWKIARLPGA
jgi:hypothetical protein